MEKIVPDKGYLVGTELYFVDIEGLNESDYDQIIESTDYEEVGGTKAALRNNLDQWRQFLNGADSESSHPVHLPLLNIPQLAVDCLSFLPEMIDNFESKRDIPLDVSNPRKLYRSDHDWAHDLNPQFETWLVEEKGVVVNPYLSNNQEEVEAFTENLQDYADRIQ